jgi:hypothetical protein
MARGVPRFNCKICDRHVSECGGLSARGKCLECGERARSENLLQINAHDGPYFENWRRQSVAAFGGVLLDVKRSAP